MSLKDFDIIAKLGFEHLTQVKEHIRVCTKFRGMQTNKSTLSRR